MDSKTKKFLIIPILLLSVLGYGQSPADMDLINKTRNLFPSSPDAAAFQKYGEVPISYYTGIPDISIPLYTVKEGDISVPITLKYHGGGIKVDEEASCVGLGWSLSNAGTFTQNVAGTEDFGYMGYALQDNSIYPSTPYQANADYNCANHGSSASLLMTPVYSKIWRTINAYVGVTGPTSQSCLLGTIKSDITAYDDFQPDLLVINTLDDSYKCYYDRITGTLNNKKYKIVGEKNIMISDTLTNGKKVLTPNGFKYLFLASEEARSFKGYNQPLLNRTHYVTSITDTRKNSINFNYIEPTNRITTLMKYSYKVVYTAAPYSNYSNYSMNGSQGDSFSGTDNYIIYNGTKYINEINFTNGKVRFTYGSREDIKNAKKLEKIEIFSGSTIIRTITFQYDYFVSTDTNGIIGQNAPINSYLYRLKLNGIVDTNEAGSYNFEYENNYLLPNKTSSSIDFWGYYNGKLNAKTYLPDLNKYQKGFIETGIANNGTLFGKKYMSSDVLTDRRASMHSLAGSLKKIIYPTGGYTEYEFEPNSFSNIPLQSQINDNTNNMKYSNISILRGNSQANSYISPPSISSFTINDAAVNAAMEVKFGWWFYNLTVVPEFYAYIKNSSGVIVKKIYNPNVGSYVDKAVTEYVNLPPGTYELGFEYASNMLSYFANIFAPGQTTYSDSPSPPVNSYLNLEYNQLNSKIGNTFYDLSYGGGLRIKKISTNDGVHPSVIKEYQYENVSTINNEQVVTSYGKLMDWPKPRRVFYDNACLPLTNAVVQVTGTTHTGYGAKAGNCPNGNQQNKPIIIVQGLSSYGTATTPQGAFVGYSKVIEKFSTGLQGKIERNFLNNYSSSLNWAGGSYDYLENGSMSLEKIYDSAGNLKKETAYTYVKMDYQTYPTQIHGVIVEPINSILHLTVGTSYSGSGSTTTVSPQSLQDYLTFYPINLYHVRLDSISTKEYFNIGESSNTVYNTYNTRHQLIESRKTSSIDNMFYKTKYQYPEPTSVEPFLTSLNTANRIDEVVGSSEYINDTKISETKKIFAKDATTSNMVLVKSLYSAKFPNSLPSILNVGNLEQKAVFDKYDDKGNVLQYTIPSGMVTSIIWGYNKTKPIAKIENAAYSTINAAYITAAQNASDAGNETSLVAALNTLRSSLSNAMVNTYTYYPLVGVRSITDPKGDTVKYNYDPSGRLASVKDKNDNILSETQYHYKD